MNRKIEIISNASEIKILAWKTINEITGRKNTPSGKIKADSPAERIQKWKHYFQNVPGKPPVVDEAVITPVIQYLLPINTDDFNKDELLKCIKTFKNGKAEGLDDIPTTIPYYNEYDHTQPILRMNQNGFRPKRSTLAKILALRRLIEGIKSEEFFFRILASVLQGDTLAPLLLFSHSIM